MFPAWPPSGTGGFARALPANDFSQVLARGREPWAPKPGIRAGPALHDCSRVTDYHILLLASCKRVISFRRRAIEPMPAGDDIAAPCGEWAEDPMPIRGLTSARGS
jgi:hypothetical protein